MFILNYKIKMTKELKDLVWTNLTKKFKKEVREEYKHQLLIDNEQAYWMLERIFGTHNLITDATEEDGVVKIVDHRII